MKIARIIKVSSHIIVWTLFLLLILNLSVSMGQGTFAQRLFSYDFFIFCLVYLCVFYVNNLILFPYLYLRKKYLLYIGIIIAFGCAVYFIRPFDSLLRPVSRNELTMPPSLPPRLAPALPPPGAAARPWPRKGPFIDFASLILFLLVWLASMALEILKQWRSSQQRALIAESDKKSAELAFLKAHINPHFLFNTLNNIYSLAIINHEQTAASILKLSNIMRYVTESVTTNFIALEDEVECIVDYIDLQKLKLNAKVYLDFSISGSTQDKVIAPLLLMTFIENIFKYGISNHHQSTITIKLFIEEKAITFYSQNKIFNPGYKHDREGFGIVNTKSRLAFLYPGRHTLDINTDNGLYTVHLTLQT